MLMETFMKENGKMTKPMGLEHTWTTKELPTLEDG